MKRAGAVVGLLALFLVTSAESCDDATSESDKIQTAQQERIAAEGVAAVGMPAIKNFREKRLLKDIFELRDQAGLSTFTYLVNMQGSLVFLCASIGYGLPYATQFTSPSKPISPGTAREYLAVPQADPNGLFSPASADGTWVMCKNPHGAEVRPVFIEPRIVVSPFELGK